MRYLGRRKSEKVRDVLVGSTAPDEVARFIGSMWAESLAGWAAAVIADMARAGWNLRYLASLAQFLWLQGFGPALREALSQQEAERGPGCVSKGRGNGLAPGRDVVPSFATASALSGRAQSGIERPTARVSSGAGNALAAERIVEVE
jgi:hypothetical protein